MKIHSLELLSLISHELRADGSCIVQCHGCFDLVHPGHIRHLQSAKKFGDVLIVTITSDSHVQKGPNRPAFSESFRTESIAALECVDYVAISTHPTAVEAIRSIRPHIFVKGPECRMHETPGLLEEIKAVHSIKGEIRYTDDVIFSSTELLNRLG